MTARKLVSHVLTPKAVADDLRSMAPGDKLHAQSQVWPVRYDGRHWWVGDVGFLTPEDAAEAIVDVTLHHN